MIRLAFAIGFLSVFGFVTYTLCVHLIEKYSLTKNKKQKKKQTKNKQT